LSFVFVAEVSMKMIAFTPHGYWQSRRNRYDTLVTVMGLVWAITNYTMGVIASSHFPMPSITDSTFFLFILERFIPFVWFRRHHPALLHHHGQTRHVENADAHRGRLRLQELFHYYGYL
jgi:hypothetical protein